MNRQRTQVPKYPCLTHLMTRGTFYDVGYNVGLKFSDPIRLFFAESDDVQDKLLPFYESRAGRDFYEKSLKVNQDCFPQYVREIRGMADGGGLPFEHLFMSNVSKEVYNVLYDKWKNASNNTETVGSKSGPTVPSATPFQENFGCSDVLINRPGHQFVVHNEDCDPAIKPYGYLLSAEIEEEGVKEQFTSFCYPSFLPGCAFNYNVHGLTISIDGLYPDFVIEDAPCRLFLNRALLKASSIDEAAKIAQNEPYGVAYGFCANISTKEGQMASLEVGPARGKALVHVHNMGMERGEGSSETGDPWAKCHYYHFNSYKHLTQVSEIKGMLSSTQRAKRASQLPPPRTLQQALQVLADTHDPLRPIFRTPRPTDLGETVCTAAFDVAARQMYVYQGREDLLNDLPFAKMSMYQ